MRGSIKALGLCLLVLLLAGCAGGTAAGDADEPLTVVGFSQTGSESDWRIANTESMVEAFRAEDGYELLVENARQKQENQMTSVRNFILQGVDVIVIAPTAETGWDNVLAEAKAAGVPVFLIDRSVSVEDKSLYLANVGSDFMQEGRQAVGWLEEELERQGRSGEELRILHLQGTYGATAQLERTQALEQAVEAHENWTIAAQLFGDFTEARAYEEVRDYLRQDLSFNVIYSENDSMTFGAMRALDEAGIPYGQGTGLMIISFDAVHRAMEYCMEGKINLCVECNPMHGPLVRELIQRYEAGEDIPKRIYVEEGIFTPEDVTPELIRQRDY